MHGSRAFFLSWRFFVVSWLSAFAIGTIRQRPTKEHSTVLYCKQGLVSQSYSTVLYCTVLQQASSVDRDTADGTVLLALTLVILSLLH